MSAGITLQEGDWTRLGEAAADIRRRVFVEEQQVPEEEEWDALDAECLHFLACREGTPLGTARLLPDGHIGRVAVLAEARGLGIGVALMQAAIAAARARQHTEVVLSAQTHALPFYARLGFIAEGDIYLDADIPHRVMRLSL